MPLLGDQLLERPLHTGREVVTLLAGRHARDPIRHWIRTWRSPERPGVEIGSNHPPHPYTGPMTRGQSSRRPGAPPTIPELLAAGSRSFSFEFFPPKDDEGERTLWQAIRELEPLRPTFVSVTYGAGGSTRDRTVRVTQRIASETTLTPVGHFTAVNHSVAELRQVIGS